MDKDDLLFSKYCIFQGTLYVQGKRFAIGLGRTPILKLKAKPTASGVRCSGTRTSILKVVKHVYKCTRIAMFRFCSSAT